MEGSSVRNKLTNVIFALFLGTWFTSIGHSAENTLRFSLIHSEIKVGDLVKQETKIYNKRFDVFAEDNVIYLTNNSIQLDDSDISCGEMLGISYSHENSSHLPSNMFQITIQFNHKGKDKLLNLSRNNLGKKLAFVFDSRLIAAPVIKNTITDGYLIVNGLSYGDVRKLDYVMHKVCAWASNVSFRSVTSNDKCTYQQPIHGTNIDGDECLSIGDQKYSVSKKVELDSSGFKDAKILLAVKAPFTENKVQELRPEDIPWRFNDEEEAARDVHAFQVKIELNEKGREILKKLSVNNAGQELATVFEGKLNYVERIPENTTSNFVLVNGLTYNQAKRLADAINRNE